MPLTIYSLEDDKDISRIINKTLSKQGYEVESFFDSTSFLKRIQEKSPNMILLDMMLPDIPGKDVLQMIRSNSIYDDIPIIIISANRMVLDKVEGLDLGADDYIEKPFDILELMSRVNAHFRRYKKKDYFKVEDMELDASKHTFTYKNKLIDLTNKEFEIMKLLLENVNEVVSRDEILKALWGETFSYQSRTVDMHIKSIRQKCENEAIIQTIHGVGYKIKI